MQVWIYLLIAITGEVFGTTFLKASDGFTRLGPTVLVVIGYAIAFFFLSLTLKTIPTGIAYAIWSGVGTVMITLVGWVFMGQRLDLPALVGIGLIITGVVVMNLFSGTVKH